MSRPRSHGCTTQNRTCHSERIARTFHVSQPYVQRVLKRVRLSSEIERDMPPGDRSIRKLAISMERASRLSKKHRWVARSTKYDEWLLMLGDATASHAVLRHKGALEPSSPWAFEAPQPVEPISNVAAAKVKAEQTPGVEYVELGRSTTGQVIDIHNSKPVSAAPVFAPCPSRTLTTREIAQMMGTGELFVAAQLGGLRFRR